MKAALRSQNLEIPSGHVDQGAKELVLRTMGRIDKVEDFRQLIVGNVHGPPADHRRHRHASTDSFVEPRNLARLDGNPAVSLLIRKQIRHQHRRGHRHVKERLGAADDRAAARHHARGRARPLALHQASRSTRCSSTSCWPSVLVSLTVMLFIANLRATLIAAVAIPTSIISTFTLMQLMGFTLNNITMLGLVLATGIVIDDAVVVLENIFRHMEEKGESPMRAAAGATKEISLAVMATTLSLVVIFLPVAFMSGRVGRFFNSYGITVACAIMVSLLVSFTLTPMLCSRFLRVKRVVPGTGGSRDFGFYSAIDRGYGALLRWSLRHRWVIVAALGGRRLLHRAAVPRRRQGLPAAGRSERVRGHRADAGRLQPGAHRRRVPRARDTAPHASRRHATC